MHFECGRNVVWPANGGVPSCDAPNPPVLNRAGHAGLCWAKCAEPCQQYCVVTCLECWPMLNIDSNAVFSRLICA